MTDKLTLGDKNKTIFVISKKTVTDYRLSKVEDWIREMNVDWPLAGLIGLLLDNQREIVEAIPNVDLAVRINRLLNELRNNG